MATDKITIDGNLLAVYEHNSEQYWLSRKVAEKAARELLQLPMPQHRTLDDLVTCLAREIQRLRSAHTIIVNEATVDAAHGE